MTPKQEMLETMNRVRGMLMHLWKFVTSQEERTAITTTLNELNSIEDLVERKAKG